MSHLRRALMVAALASSPTLAQAQQPGQVQPGQVQPGQPTHRSQAQQSQGIPLTAFIAHQLKRGNEAEVELGQMASERAKTDSVKQFAQMMVKEHQQMMQQLEQFDQGVGSPRGSKGDATSSNPNPGRTGIPGQQELPNRGQGDRPRSNERNSESNTDDNQRNERAPTTATSQASSGAGQSASAATPVVPAGRDQTGVQPNQPGVGQNANQTGTSNAGINPGGLNPGGQAGRGMPMGGMQGHVPHMLVAVSDQACDNELQLTRQMLEKHDGENFEMAYVGQQIVAHTCMLAKLQALKNSGPSELQQLVSQGEQKTRQHLDQAMKIAEELGQDKK